MRPRKRIFIATLNEHYRDSYSLLLKTWGYAIAPEDCTPEAVLAVELPPEQIPSLILRYDPVSIVARVHHPIERQAALNCGAMFAAADNTALREYLRTVTARKRGPKRIAVSGDVTTQQTPATTAPTLR